MPFGDIVIFSSFASEVGAASALKQIKRWLVTQAVELELLPSGVFADVCAGVSPGASADTVGEAGRNSAAAERGLVRILALTFGRAGRRGVLCSHDAGCSRWGAS